MIKIIFFTHLLAYVGFYLYVNDLNKHTNPNYYTHNHTNTHNPTYTSINVLYDMDLLDY